ncbi:uncharacterized protein LOC125179536 [Hyalella azteca]|uniref:Uncharacterized protein LOC125179536 n=1 Tax=Hyalella azteca TaxID=294128 RepID=A0A979FYF2_HYAAZ|nr:uncharacterized protein LOC125179536 [Hyalella azteca]
MSFLSSLQQVVADVTTSVTNLSLNPTRRFSRDHSQPDNISSATTAPTTGSATATGSRSRLGPRLIPTPGTTTTSVNPGSSRFRSGSTSVQGGLGPGGKPIASVMRPPHHQQLQAVAPRKDYEVQPLPQLQCGDRYTYWPEYDPAQNWVGEKDGGWLEMH